MKPNFKSGVLFGENLMGCEMGKIKVVMNKPVYLGQAILDTSKIVMYEFHYDYMKPKYGENLKLWTLIRSCITLRPKISMKTSLEMSRRDSIQVDTVRKMLEQFQILNNRTK